MGCPSQTEQVFGVMREMLVGNWDGEGSDRLRMMPSLPTFHKEKEIIFRTWGFHIKDFPLPTTHTHTQCAKEIFIV